MLVNKCHYGVSLFIFLIADTLLAESSLTRTREIYSWDKANAAATTKMDGTKSLNELSFVQTLKHPTTMPVHTRSRSGVSWQHELRLRGQLTKVMKLLEKAQAGELPPIAPMALQTEGVQSRKGTSPRPYSQQSLSLRSSIKSPATSTASQWGTESIAPSTTPSFTPFPAAGTPTEDSQEYVAGSSASRISTAQGDLMQPKMTDTRRSSLRNESRGSTSHSIRGLSIAPRMLPMMGLPRGKAGLMMPLRHYISPAPPLPPLPPSSVYGFGNISLRPFPPYLTSRLFQKVKVNASPSFRIKFLRMPRPTELTVQGHELIRRVLDKDSMAIDFIAPLPSVQLMEGEIPHSELDNTPLTSMPFDYFNAILAIKPKRDPADAGVIQGTNKKVGMHGVHHLLELEKENKHIKEMQEAAKSEAKNQASKPPRFPSATPKAITDGNKNEALVGMNGVEMQPSLMSYLSMEDSMLLQSQSGHGVGIHNVDFTPSEEEVYRRPRELLREIDSGTETALLLALGNAKIFSNSLLVMQSMHMRRVAAGARPWSHFSSPDSNRLLEELRDARHEGMKDDEREGYRPLPFISSSEKELPPAKPWEENWEKPKRRQSFPRLKFFDLEKDAPAKTDAITEQYSPEESLDTSRLSKIDNLALTTTLASTTSVDPLLKSTLPKKSGTIPPLSNASDMESEKSLNLIDQRPDYMSGLSQNEYAGAVIPPDLRHAPPEALSNPAYLVRFDKAWSGRTWYENWYLTDQQNLSFGSPGLYLCGCGCGQTWGAHSTFAPYTGGGALSGSPYDMYHRSSSFIQTQMKAGVSSILVHDPKFRFGTPNVVLDLSGWRVDASTVAFFSRSPHRSSIRVLRMSAWNGPSLTSPLLLAFLYNLPNLAHVHIPHSYALDAHTCQAISKAPCAKSLLSLDISLSPVLTNEGIDELVKGCTGLTSLNVSGCTQLTDTAIKRVGDLRQLESVDLSWIPMVTDEGVGALIAGGTKLKRLSLRGIGSGFKAGPPVPEPVSSTPPPSRGRSRSPRMSPRINTGGSSRVASLSPPGTPNASRRSRRRRSITASHPVPSLTTGEVTDGLGGRPFLLHLLSGMRVQLLCHLVEIDLEGTVGITDAVIILLAANSEKKIEKLRLSHQTSLTTASTTAIATFCPNLTHLYLAGCTGLQSPLLDGKIAARLAVQRQMDRTGGLVPDTAAAYGIGWGVLQEFYHQDRKGPREGVLFNTPGSTPMDQTGKSDTPVYKEGRLDPKPQWTKLRLVDVSGCQGIWESDFVSLFSVATDLEEIRVSGCQQITDNAVLPLVSNRPLLHTLRMGYLPGLTDAGVEIISKCIPDLRTFDITGCTNVSDTGLSYVAMFCKNLENFHYNYASSAVTMQGILKLVMGCRKLKILELAALSEHPIYVNATDQQPKMNQSLNARSLLHSRTGAVSHMSPADFSSQMAASSIDQHSHINSSHKTPFLESTSRLHSTSMLDAEPEERNYDNTFPGDLFEFICCIGLACPFLEQLDLSGRVPAAAHRRFNIEALVQGFRAAADLVSTVTGVYLETGRMRSSMNQNLTDVRTPVAQMTARFDRKMRDQARSNKGMDNDGTQMMEYDTQELHNSMHASYNAPWEASSQLSNPFAATGRSMDYDGTQTVTGLGGGVDVLFPQLQRLAIAGGGPILDEQLTLLFFMTPSLLSFNCTRVPGISTRSLQIALHHSQKKYVHMIAQGPVPGVEAATMHMQHALHASLTHETRTILANSHVPGTPAYCEQIAPATRAGSKVEIRSPAATAAVGPPQAALPPTPLLRFRPFSGGVYDVSPSTPYVPVSTFLRALSEIVQPGAALIAGGMGASVLCVTRDVPFVPHHPSLPVPAKAMAEALQKRSGTRASIPLLQANVAILISREMSKKHLMHLLQTKVLKQEEYDLIMKNYIESSSAKEARGDEVQGVVIDGLDATGLPSLQGIRIPSAALEALPERIDIFSRFDEMAKSMDFDHLANLPDDQKLLTASLLTPLAVRDPVSALPAYPPLDVSTAAAVSMKYIAQALLSPSVAEKSTLFTAPWDASFPNSPHFSGSMNSLEFDTIGFGMKSPSSVDSTGLPPPIQTEASVPIPSSFAPALGFDPVPGACFLRESDLLSQHIAVERAAVNRIRKLILHGLRKEKEWFWTMRWQIRVRVEARRQRSARRIQVAYRAHKKHSEWKRHNAACLLQSFWRKIRRIDAVRRKFLEALSVVRAARMKQLASSLVKRTVDSIFMRLAWEKLRFAALQGRWEDERRYNRLRGMVPVYGLDGRLKVQFAMPKSGPMILGEEETWQKRVKEGAYTTTTAMNQFQEALAARAHVIKGSKRVPEGVRALAIGEASKGEAAVNWGAIRTESTVINPHTRKPRPLQPSEDPYEYAYVYSYQGLQLAPPRRVRRRKSWILHATQVIRKVAKQREMQRESVSKAIQDSLGSIGGASVYKQIETSPQDVTASLAYSLHPKKEKKADEITEKDIMAPKPERGERPRRNSFDLLSLARLNPDAPMSMMDPYHLNQSSLRTNSLSRPQSLLEPPSATASLVSLPPYAPLSAAPQPRYMPSSSSAGSFGASLKREAYAPTVIRYRSLAEKKAAMQERAAAKVGVDVQESEASDHPKTFMSVYGELQEQTSQLSIYDGSQLSPSKESVEHFGSIYGVSQEDLDTIAPGGGIPGPEYLEDDGWESCGSEDEGEVGFVNIDGLVHDKREPFLNGDADIKIFRVGKGPWGTVDLNESQFGDSMFPKALENQKGLHDLNLGLDPMEDTLELDDHFFDALAAEEDYLKREAESNKNKHRRPVPFDITVASQPSILKSSRVGEVRKLLHPNAPLLPLLEKELGELRETLYGETSDLAGAEYFQQMPQDFGGSTELPLGESAEFTKKGAIIVPDDIQTQSSVVKDLSLTLLSPTASIISNGSPYPLQSSISESGLFHGFEQYKAPEKPNQYSIKASSTREYYLRRLVALKYHIKHVAEEIEMTKKHIEFGEDDEERRLRQERHDYDQRMGKNASLTLPRFAVLDEWQEFREEKIKIASQRLQLLLDDVKLSVERLKEFERKLLLGKRRYNVRQLAVQDASEANPMLLHLNSETKRFELAPDAQEEILTRYVKKEGEVPPHGYSLTQYLVKTDIHKGASNDPVTALLARRQQDFGNRVNAVMGLQITPGGPMPMPDGTGFFGRRPDGTIVEAMKYTQDARDHFALLPPADEHAPVGLRPGAAAAMGMAVSRGQTATSTKQLPIRHAPYAVIPGPVDVYLPNPEGIGGVPTDTFGANVIKRTGLSLYLKQLGIEHGASIAQTFAGGMVGPLVSSSLPLESLASLLAPIGLVADGKKRLIWELREYFQKKQDRIEDKIQQQTVTVRHFQSGLARRIQKWWRAMLIRKATIDSIVKDQTEKMRSTIELGRRQGYVQPQFAEVASPAEYAAAVTIQRYFRSYSARLYYWRLVRSNAVFSARRVLRELLPLLQKPKVEESIRIRILTSELVTFSKKEQGALWKLRKLSNFAYKMQLTFEKMQVADPFCTVASLKRVSRLLQKQLRQLNEMKMSGSYSSAYENRDFDTEFAMYEAMAELGITVNEFTQVNAESFDPRVQRSLLRNKKWEAEIAKNAEPLIIAYSEVSKLLQLLSQNNGRKRQKWRGANCVASAVTTGLDSSFQEISMGEDSTNFSAYNPASPYAASVPINVNLNAFFSDFQLDRSNNVTSSSNNNQDGSTADSSAIPNDDSSNRGIKKDRAISTFDTTATTVTQSAVDAPALSKDNAASVTKFPGSSGISTPMSRPSTRDGLHSAGSMRGGIGERSVVALVSTVAALPPLPPANSVKRINERRRRKFIAGFLPPLELEAYHKVILEDRLVRRRKQTLESIHIIDTSVRTTLWETLPKLAMIKMKELSEKGLDREHFHKYWTRVLQVMKDTYDTAPDLTDPFLQLGKLRLNYRMNLLKSRVNLAKSQMDRHMTNVLLYNRLRKWTQRMLELRKKREIRYQELYARFDSEIPQAQAVVYFLKRRRIQLLAALQVYKKGQKSDMEVSLWREEDLKKQLIKERDEERKALLTDGHDPSASPWGARARDGPSGSIHSPLLSSRSGSFVGRSSARDTPEDDPNRLIQLAIRDVQMESILFPESEEEQIVSRPSTSNGISSLQSPRSTRPGFLELMSPQSARLSISISALTNRSESNTMITSAASREEELRMQAQEEARKWREKRRQQYARYRQRENDKIAMEAAARAIENMKPSAMAQFFAAIKLTDSIAEKKKALQRRIFDEVRKDLTIDGTEDPPSDWECPDEDLEDDQKGPGGLPDALDATLRAHLESMYSEELALFRPFDVDEASAEERWIVSEVKILEQTISRLESTYQSYLTQSFMRSTEEMEALIELGDLHQQIEKLHAQENLLECEVAQLSEEILTVAFCEQCEEMLTRMTQLLATSRVTFGRKNPALPLSAIPVNELYYQNPHNMNPKFWEMPVTGTRAVELAKKRATLPPDVAYALETQLGAAYTSNPNHPEYKRIYREITGQEPPTNNNIMSPILDGSSSLEGLDPKSSENRALVRWKKQGKVRRKSETERIRQSLILEKQRQQQQAELWQIARAGQTKGTSLNPNVALIEDVPASQMANQNGSKVLTEEELQNLRSAKSNQLYIRRRKKVSGPEETEEITMHSPLPAQSLPDQYVPGGVILGGLNSSTNDLGGRFGRHVKSTETLVRHMKQNDELARKKRAMRLQVMMSKRSEMNAKRSKEDSAPPPDLEGTVSQIDLFPSMDMSQLVEDSTFLEDSVLSHYPSVTSPESARRDGTNVSSSVPPHRSAHMDDQDTVDAFESWMNKSSASAGGSHTPRHSRKSRSVSSRRSDKRASSQRQNRRLVNHGFNAQDPSVFNGLDPQELYDIDTGEWDIPRFRPAMVRPTRTSLRYYSIGGDGEEVGNPGFYYWGPDHGTITGLFGVKVRLGVAPSVKKVVPEDVLLQYDSLANESEETLGSGNEGQDVFFASNKAVVSVPLQRELAALQKKARDKTKTLRGERRKLVREGRLTIPDSLPTKPEPKQQPRRKSSCARDENKPTYAPNRNLSPSPVRLPMSSVDAVRSPASTANKPIASATTVATNPVPVVSGVPALPMSDEEHSDHEQVIIGNPDLTGVSIPTRDPEEWFASAKEAEAERRAKFKEERVVPLNKTKRSSQTQEMLGTRKGDALFNMDDDGVVRRTIDGGVDKMNKLIGWEAEMEKRKNIAEEFVASRYNYSDQNNMDQDSDSDQAVARPLAVKPDSYKKTESALKARQAYREDRLPLDDENVNKGDKTDEESRDTAKPSANNEENAMVDVTEDARNDKENESPLRKSGKSIRFDPESLQPDGQKKKGPTPAIGGALKPSIVVQRSKSRRLLLKSQRSIAVDPSLSSPLPVGDMGSSSLKQLMSPRGAGEPRSPSLVMDEPYIMDTTHLPPMSFTALSPTLTGDASPEEEERVLTILPMSPTSARPSTMSTRVIDQAIPEEDEDDAGESPVHSPGAPVSSSTPNGKIPMQLSLDLISPKSTTILDSVSPAKTLEVTGGASLQPKASGFSTLSARIRAPVTPSSSAQPAESPTNVPTLSLIKKPTDEPLFAHSSPDPYAHRIPEIDAGDTPEWWKEFGWKDEQIPMTILCAKKTILDPQVQHNLNLRHHIYKKEDIEEKPYFRGFGGGRLISGTPEMYKQHLAEQVMRVQDTLSKVIKQRESITHKLESLIAQMEKDYEKPSDFAPPGVVRKLRQISIQKTDLPHYNQWKEDHIARYRLRYERVKQRELEKRRRRGVTDEDIAMEKQERRLRRKIERRMNVTKQGADMKGEEDSDSDSSVNLEQKALENILPGEEFESHGFQGIVAPDGTLLSWAGDGASFSLNTWRVAYRVRPWTIDLALFKFLAKQTHQNFRDDAEMVSTLLRQGAQQTFTNVRVGGEALPVTGLEAVKQNLARRRADAQKIEEEARLARKREKEIAFAKALGGKLAVEDEDEKKLEDEKTLEELQKQQAEDAANQISSRMQEAGTLGNASTLDDVKNALKLDARDVLDSISDTVRQAQNIYYQMRKDMADAKVAGNVELQRTVKEVRHNRDLAKGVLEGISTFHITFGVFEDSDWASEQVARYNNNEPYYRKLNINIGSINDPVFIWYRATNDPEDMISHILWAPYDQTHDSIVNLLSSKGYKYVTHPAALPDVGLWYVKDRDKRPITSLSVAFDSFQRKHLLDLGFTIADGDFSGPFIHSGAQLFYRAGKIRKKKVESEKQLVLKTEIESIRTKEKVLRSKLVDKKILKELNLTEEEYMKRLEDGTLAINKSLAGIEHSTLLAGWEDAKRILARKENRFVEEREKHLEDESIKFLGLTSYDLAKLHEAYLKIHPNPKPLLKRHQQLLKEGKDVTEMRVEIPLERMYIYFDVDPSAVTDSIFYFLDPDFKGVLTFPTFLRSLTAFCMFGKEDIITWAFAVVARNVIARAEAFRDVSDGQGGLIGLDRKTNAKVYWEGAGLWRNLKPSISVDHITVEGFSHLLYSLHAPTSALSLTVRRAITQAESIAVRGHLRLFQFQNINVDFPTLLSPLFLVQASLRQNFLGHSWWAQKRQIYKDARALVREQDTLNSRINLLAHKGEQARINRDARRGITTSTGSDSYD